MWENLTQYISMKYTVGGDIKNEHKMSQFETLLSVDLRSASLNFNR